jgi:hypothetical protein
MPSLVKIYKDTALILLNTIVVLLLLNVVLGVVYFAYDTYVERQKNNQVGTFTENGAPTDNGKRSQYQLKWFDYNATTEVSREHASEVLDDYYALGQKGFIYQPWVQFSEPQFAGKHVTVDINEHGFTHRRTVNPHLSGPVVDVFVFGGSTTFGYNVADQHTWPSYLSAILNDKARNEGFQVRVTNFGRGYYDTSQELALIVSLLKSGYRPKLALFMDGVNLGPVKDEPVLTAQVAQALDNAQHGREKLSPGLKQWLRTWVPMVRLVLSIKSQVSNSAEQTADLTHAEPHMYVERLRQNRRIIKDVCAQYGVETLFFLQPDPIYNYPAQLYRTTLPETFLGSRKLRQGFYVEIRKGSEWIYLGELFEEFGVNQGRKAIVDDVHYSPNFSKFLAARVAAHVDLRRYRPTTNSND